MRFHYQHGLERFHSWTSQALEASGFVCAERDRVSMLMSAAARLQEFGEFHKKRGENYGGQWPARNCWHLC